MKHTGLALTGIAAATMLLGGCGGSGQQDRVTVGELRRNPTPELSHASRSGAQVRNDRARIIDLELRNAKDDLDRLLLLNQASRMQPEIVP